MNLACRGLSYFASPKAIQSEYKIIRRLRCVKLKAQAVAEFEKDSLVFGRVTSVDRNGATVSVGGDFEGHLPGQEGPWTLGTTGKRQAMQNVVPVGLQREFIVLEVDKELGNGRQGKPVLSARAVDKDILWKRMEQMHEICTESCENFNVKITGANTGGITCIMGGLPAFIPVSQLEKKADGSWWTQEEMCALYFGLLKMTVLRRLEVGALVEGVVRRIEPFGVFVGIKGTRVSGLLHVSNISRLHVDNPGEVFKVGEKLSALILGIDYDYSNISLSTAELEIVDGEVLGNKDQVWANAGEQAALFQQQLAEDARY
ncbi:hypothetical protein Ndes2437B_g06756 [Nannochloris sp. 'desiccata']